MSDIPYPEMMGMLSKVELPERGQNVKHFEYVSSEEEDTVIGKGKGA